jgi:hypothetical protein
VQGSPGGEGAERDNLETPSHRILGPIGMEQTISGESDVQTIFETLLTTSSPPNQPPDFLKPPALLGVNLRAGSVGSVWGLAPGKCGRAGDTSR